MSQTQKSGFCFVAAAVICTLTGCATPDAGTEASGTTTSVVYERAAVPTVMTVPEPNQVAVIRKGQETVLWLGNDNLFIKKPVEWIDPPSKTDEAPKGASAAGYDLMRLLQRKQ